MEGPRTLLFKGLKARYAREQELEDIEVVLPIPFNSNRAVDGKPDESNRHIAIVAKRIAEKYKARLFAQRENAEVLRALGIEPEQELKTWIEQKPNGKWHTEHVSTEKFMAWAAALLEPGTKVAVIGHSHHVRRAAALARYYGLNAVVPEDVDEIDTYDPEGGQYWCQNAGRYIIWEYLQRLRMIVTPNSLMPKKI